ncbi:unnamed protein product [Agarophyton chilense]
MSSRQHRQLISLVKSLTDGRNIASTLPTSPQTASPPELVPHKRMSPLQTAVTPPVPPPMLCTLAMAGIQLCYAAQINLGTAHLVHLGLRHSHASLAWLAGPLSGLLFQPLIGALSDNCTHPLGRRRPFLIVGCLFTCLSLFAFSNAQQIAHMLQAEHSALSVAIAAFFTLDFSIQAIQAPLRALVIDVMPAAKLSAANSCIALHCGIGNLIGGCLVAVPWSTWLPHVSNIQMVFAISSLLLVMSTALTVVSTPEQMLIRDTSVPRSSSSGRLSQPPSLSSRSSSVSSRLFKTLAAIPSPFWGVFGVQLCTWCGFFALFVYVNTWVGHNVFMGDGSKPISDTRRQLFDAGVRLGGTANAMTAAVTIAYSCILPRMVRAYGVTSMYLVSQCVEAITLMGAMFIRARSSPPSVLLQLVAVLNVGAFGVVWATTMSLPWTLIVRALECDSYYAAKKGLFTTVFNASQSLPQLVVAVVAPLILAARDDAADVMFVGGMVAVVGAVLVVWLRIEERVSKTASRHADGVAPSVSMSSMRVE